MQPHTDACRAVPYSFYAGKGSRRIPLTSVTAQTTFVWWHLTTICDKMWLMSCLTMQKWRYYSAWVSGLWSLGEEGNVPPVAELHKGLSYSKALYAQSCCFSATGSYVLSHFPLDNPSLHKTCNQLSGYSEGTQRLSITVTSAYWERALERGTVREENPALLFSARPARSKRVVWEQGGSKSRRGGGGFVGFNGSRT